jgi:hypothetical protein
MSKRRAHLKGREHKKDDYNELPGSFADRRVAGGEPPSPAAYACAPMQWQQLCEPPFWGPATLMEGSSDGK